MDNSRIFGGFEVLQFINQGSVINLAELIATQARENNQCNEFLSIMITAINLIEKELEKETSSMAGVTADLFPVENLDEGQEVGIGGLGRMAEMAAKLIEEVVLPLGKELLEVGHVEATVEIAGFKAATVRVETVKRETSDG